MVEDPCGGCRQVPGDRRRRRVEALFVAVAIFAGAHQNGLGYPSLERAGHIAFHVVAHHHSIAWRAIHARKRRVEEVGRGFAEYHRLLAARYELLAEAFGLPSATR